MLVRWDFTLDIGCWDVILRTTKRWLNISFKTDKKHRGNMPTEAMITYLQGDLWMLHWKNWKGGLVVLHKKNIMLVSKYFVRNIITMSLWSCERRFHVTAAVSLFRVGTGLKRHFVPRMRYLKVAETCRITTCMYSGIPSKKLEMLIFEIRIIKSR